MTSTVACGSPAGGPAAAPPTQAPPVTTTTIVDAAVDAPPKPVLACDAGTTLAVAPAPEPTWFCTKGNVKHGAFVTLFPDGSTQISGLYKDGLLDGAWQRRHASGALAEAGAYVAGQKHGTWKQLDPSGKVLGQYDLAAGTGIERRWLDDGTLYSEIAMKSGVPHGPAKFFERDGSLLVLSRFADGKLDGEQVTGTSRTLRFTEKYSNGVLTGKRKIYEGYTLLADELYDRRGKLDGRYQLWRNKKITRAEGQFSHGKRTGAWVWHDGNGNIEKEGSYADGKKTGTWNEYVEGKLAFTARYVADKADGEVIYFDRNGGELGKFTMNAGSGTWMTFWSNRKPSSKTRMSRGVADGLYQELTSRGKVVVEGRYRGGQKHGTWKEWTEGRVLVLEQSWKHGKLDGIVKKYVDGKPSLEVTYQGGQVAGAYAEHRNGKPALTGQYASDYKTGTWTHYAADGSVVLTATYKTGVLDGPWRELVDGSVLEGTMVGGRRSGTWTLTDKAGSVRKLHYTTP